MTIPKVWWHEAVNHKWLYTMKISDYSCQLLGFYQNLFKPLLLLSIVFPAECIFTMEFRKNYTKYSWTLASQPISRVSAQGVLSPLHTFSKNLNGRVCSLCIDGLSLSILNTLDSIQAWVLEDKLVQTTEWLIEENICVPIYILYLNNFSKEAGPPSCPYTPRLTTQSHQESCLLCSY